MAGTPSANFVITPLADMLVEGEETFIVTVSNPRAAQDGFDVSLLSASVNVQINDRDAAVLLVSVNPVDLILDEDEDGMNTAIFTVRLRGGVTAVENIDISWRVNCAIGVTGVASPMDFANGECPSGTVTIAARETSTDFSFMTFDDDNTEGLERFTVSITATTAGDFDVTFDENSSDTLMRDMTLRDDEAVTISVIVNPLSVPEEGSVTFYLLLSQTVPEPLPLPWEISFGTASASDFEDGQALLGAVTIPAFTLTSAPVTLTVAMDNLVEGEEVFRVIVPTTSRITSDLYDIADEVFTSDLVRILDGTTSDLSVSVDAQIVDDGVNEGDDIEFTVSLSDDDTAGRDLAFEVSCGGEVSEEDFVNGCVGVGGVSILAGGRSATFTVTTTDDSVVEGSEMFSVTVTPADPASDELRLTPITAVSPQIVINDDDSGVISVTVGTNTVSEGEGVTFTVILSGGVTAGKDIDVIWRVDCGAGSEVTDDDFVGDCPSDRVKIESGSISADFTITAFEDMLVEGMEMFAVTLTGVSPTIEGRITISAAADTASLTITDGDAAELSLTAVSPRVSEGDSATFTVMLGNGVAVGETIAVGWVVECPGSSGDITSGDFVGGCPSGTATIAVDTSSDEFTVSVSEDMLAEGEEMFIVTLSDPRAENDGFAVSLSSASDSVSVMITEGDADAATISLSGDATVSEGTSATFTVTLEQWSYSG